MVKSWVARGAVAVLLASFAFMGMGADAGMHPGRAVLTAPTTTAVLAAGPLAPDAGSWRNEVGDAAMARTAVLIGDSQASGARGVQGRDTWVQSALAARGYSVDFLGAGGTGYVARTAMAANYPDGIESGHVVLPRGNPALVVVQGGGNDASRGVSDAQILGNAGRLLQELRANYPNSQLLVIGILAKGGQAGGRRTEVDTLLAGFAKSHEIPFISAGDWLNKYGAIHEMVDGVHLTAAGHQNLSKVMEGRLEELKLQAPGVDWPGFPNPVGEGQRRPAALSLMYRSASLGGSSCGAASTTSTPACNR